MNTWWRWMLLSLYPDGAPRSNLEKGVEVAIGKAASTWDHHHASAHRRKVQHITWTRLASGTDSNASFPVLDEVLRMASLASPPPSPSPPITPRPQYVAKVPCNWVAALPGPLGSSPPAHSTSIPYLT